MWTNDQLRLLINERKSNNTEYHNIVGSSRVDFWNDVANKINEQFHTNYTGHQYKDKFRNLVNNHNSLCRYMAGNKNGRRTRVAEKYFDEFRSRFWERPGKSISRREESQRSRTPPPSYEEVSSMLDRCEVSASHRDRSASPTRRTPGRRDETINQDNASNVNDAGGNLDNNTNNAGGNLDNATYSN
ncbi:7827_t:CDS:2 [Entrophospora sp. SA101]|nr:4087_t:CDS:2 [Entrophospora sp. SA101]CAJ0830021.1 7827_t:CDS:2 [Entrophospora sp. SA101]